MISVVEAASTSVVAGIVAGIVAGLAVVTAVGVVCGDERV